MSTLRGSKNYVWDTTKPLGQGATSMVYVGREKRTGEEVAVKVFTPQSYQRPRQVQQREFEVMRLLNHENVVRLLAIEEEQTMNGGDVIVMELCPHGSLYNVLDSPENSFGLCEDEFLLVLKQVAAGVKHLRDHDIIHRDIKPGNILRCVAEDGRSIYKLTDFGAARELQENEEFVSLYGTEEYLHPDMYERAVLRHVRGQQFGVHVDLWSLGVTFYHAATGNLPFRPYGGRRNKETMHLITAQKEPGVISGVQLTENGPIEWRKELPSTCRLSLGLRRLITPFLAALLEREPSRTWPFDQFFEQVALITGKMVIDVFCPSSLSPLKIYADQNNVLPQLQELITEQTDIKPAEQLLLCGGQELTSLVQASQPISKYHLDISSTSPIIVYSTSGTLPQSPVTPTIGQFPQMTDKVALDHDYPQAKRCCGVVHTIQDAVKSIADVTVLMNLGVHMFCANLKCQVERQQEAQVHISQQMAIINQWHHMTFTHLQHHLNLLNLTLLSSGPSSIKVSSWLKVIHASQQTARRDCGELLDMLGSSNQQIQTQLPQAEDMLKQVHEWDTCLACTPQDRCAEKIKVMLDRVKKIMSMFKENRNKRHLNFNEDQIHKFEKNKLGELCTRARSLLTDHCIVRRKKLYSAYKLWFEKATQCQTLIIKVNTSLAQMTEYQCQLVNRLKNAEGQWNKLIDDCVEHLKKEIQAAIPPVLLNPVPAGVIQNNGHLNGSGDSLDFANSQLSDHGNGSSASRQERLGSLVDGIHTYRKALEEVEILANENMQRLRYFSLLTEETVSGENGL